MNRLRGIGRAERSVRNSRFVAVCGPVTGEAEAMTFVQRHGEPGCRHVCWAFRCGDAVRFDDAGEPGGTAGQPILAALDHREIDGAVAVVSRWFGGVKLGTGGLVRAYGGAAAQAIDDAGTEPIVTTRRLRCRVPFDAADVLHRLLDRHAACKLDERWTHRGLDVVLELPDAECAGFRRALEEATRGAAEWHAEIDS